MDGGAPAAAAATTTIKHRRRAAKRADKKAEALAKGQEKLKQSTDDFSEVRAPEVMNEDDAAAAATKSKQERMAAEVAVGQEALKQRLDDLYGGGKDLLWHVLSGEGWGNYTIAKMLGQNGCGAYARWMQMAERCLHYLEKGETEDVEAQQLTRFLLIYIDAYMELRVDNYSPQYPTGETDRFQRETNQLFLAAVKGWMCMPVVRDEIMGYGRGNSLNQSVVPVQLLEQTRQVIHQTGTGILNETIPRRGSKKGGFPLNASELLCCLFTLLFVILLFANPLSTADAFLHSPVLPRPRPSSFSSLRSSRPRTLPPSILPSFCQACFDNDDILNLLLSHRKPLKNKKLGMERQQQQQQQQQQQRRMNNRKRLSYLESSSLALAFPLPLSPSFLASITDEDNNGNKVEDENEDPKAEQEEEEQNLSATLLINFFRGYKQFISPLLPQACRFFPTCSEYAIESIQTFGPGKGTILTIWRLLRCNPLGGKGWDPPQWPPPGWFAGGTGR